MPSLHDDIKERGYYYRLNLRENIRRQMENLPSHPIGHCANLFLTKVLQLHNTEIKPLQYSND